jgi:hypothetical protein
MKRIVFVICFFWGCTLSSTAQGITPKDGRLDALKIAYITTKLNLSTSEAQKFWPLYNRYMDEIRHVKTKNRDLDEIAFEESIINIRKKYKSEFTNALPEERVNQFFKVDKEFNNIIRRELHDREQLKQLRQQNTRPFSP